MSPHRPSQPPSRDDDDLVEELPPMDGEEGDDEPVEAFDAEQLSPFDDMQGEEDDDKAATSLPIGDPIDALPDAPDTSLEAAADADETDTGDGGIAFIDEMGGSEDDDEEGVAGDDITLGVDALADLGGDDEGEGTDEPLEDEVDESAFPPLDADEDGGFADSLDVGELDLPEEVSMPAWSAVRWERVEAPLVAVPMRHVACGPRLVASAGEGAVVLTYAADEPPAACRFLPLEGRDGAELIGIGVGDADGNELVFASRQRLMISTDAGRHVRWIAHVFDEGPGAELIRVEVGSFTGFAYACTSKGRLLVSAAPGRAWRTIDGVGIVHALAIDEAGTAHVLASQNEELHWLRSDEGGRWEAKTLRGDPRKLPVRARPIMAVRGSTWVIGSAAGDLLVSLDVGESWQQVRLPAHLRAATVVPGDEGDSIVGAIYSESEDRSYLFAWHPGQAPVLVADLSPDVVVGTVDLDPSEGLGRAHHVLWDPFRSCVWVAGSFGLCAWRPALPA